MNLSNLGGQWIIRNIQSGLGVWYEPVKEFLLPPGEG